MLKILSPLIEKSMEKMGSKSKFKPQFQKKKVVIKSKRSKKLSSSSSINVCQEIQKGLDTALMKLSPKLQVQIDQMVQTLEKSSFNLEDLRTLGYQVLKQASQISENIKMSPMFTTSLSSLISKTRSTHLSNRGSKKTKKVKA